jgi:putative transposase
MTYSGHGYFTTPSYKHHRFPPAIIRHGVWRYVRFCLSDRDGEALLFARGSRRTYDALRP